MGEKSKVLISLSFRNLPTDSFEFYYATMRVATGGYFHDRDTISTEKTEECKDIDFIQKLQIEYVFEEKQIIRMELYGLTNGVGSCVAVSECSVGRIIHSGGELSKFSEWNWKSETIEIELIFKVTEDASAKDNLEIKMQGYGLDKKDIFGKSDPYIVIYRRTEKGKLIRTYRSEVVKNTLNPDWKALVASLERLCGNDLDCEIVIKCFDWDGANGDPEDMDTEFDELIGEFTTTTRYLLSSNGEQKKFELINSRKKRKKKNYHHSGLVTITTIQTITDLSFLDYMFGGTDLNFIVAIDLTSSNGDVEDPSSLHYMDANNTNEYSVAIQAVLEILQEYDNDEMFPAFGFGARVPPDFKISHEYPLNGDYSNPFCKGVEGVMRAYRESLLQVKLSGPTHFAPVIRQVSNLSKEHKDGSHYFILLILTDGSVDDWVETKRAVIEASYLPVSIIVIGVGGRKFSDMEILDQDFKLLRVGNDQACRDNVQFVPMRRFLRPAADGSDSIRWNKISLAKEVLAELPLQVLHYMSRNKGALGPRRSEHYRYCSMKDLLRQFSQDTRLRRCATSTCDDQSPKKISQRRTSSCLLKAGRQCSVDTSLQTPDSKTRSSYFGNTLYP